MCAIVPFTPSVVTLPLIVPSSATRKLPVPLASVFAAGTSSAPVRFTFMAPLPGIQSGILSRIPAQAASDSTANIATMRFMVVLQYEVVNRCAG